MSGILPPMRGPKSKGIMQDLGNISKTSKVQVLVCGLLIEHLVEKSVPLSFWKCAPSATLLQQAIIDWKHSSKESQCDTGMQHDLCLPKMNS